MALFRRLLGDVLRERRLEQGLTLRQVSAEARVSLGYISEIERGQKEASSELAGLVVHGSRGAVVRGPARRVRGRRSRGGGHRSHPDHHPSSGRGLGRVGRLIVMKRADRELPTRGRGLRRHRPDPGGDRLADRGRRDRHRRADRRARGRRRDPPLDAFRGSFLADDPGASRLPATGAAGRLATVGRRRSSRLGSPTWCFVGCSTGPASGRRRRCRRSGPTAWCG